MSGHDLSAADIQAIARMIAKESAATTRILRAEIARVEAAVCDHARVAGAVAAQLAQRVDALEAGGVVIDARARFAARATTHADDERPCDV